MMRSLLKREDFYLFLIFLLMAFGILTKSFLSPDGYLSPDSTGYLSVAQSLIDGNGFYVYESHIPSPERKLFAVTPLGYPTLIYLVSKISGLSVFLASKILNIIFIGISLLIFRKLFKENAYVYSLIFFAATFIVVFTHTWSEVPFIFSFLWFSAAIFYFFQNKQSNLLLLNLFFSALFMFLCRYIGAFGFLSLGLISLYFLTKKDRKIFLKLAITSFLGFVLIGLYLYNNYIETGYFTGIPRFSSSVGFPEFFTMFMRASLIEFNLIRTPGSPFIDNYFKFFSWFFVQIGLFSYFFWKAKNHLKKTDKNEPENHLGTVFFSIGAIYLLSLLAISFLFQIVDLYCRYMAPASFLFLIALISYVEFNYSQEAFKYLRIFVLSVCLISFLLNVPLITLKTLYLNKGKPLKTYFNTVKEVRYFYRNIPGNSVVVFPNKHLYYLRTDLIGLTPYCIGFASRKKEDMESFINRINNLYPKKEVYFQTKNVLANDKNLDTCHESVIKFINNHQGKKFVQIK